MSIGTIANSITALTYGQPARQHRPPAMTGTAKLVGLSPDELRQDMRSGSSLSSVASAKGISSSDLLAAVEADLHASTAQGGPTLSDARLSVMATSMINGTFAPGAPGRPGGPDRAAGADHADAPASAGAPGGAVAVSSLAAPGAISGPFSNLTELASTVSSATATSNLQSLAKAAGMDPTSLLQHLASGTSLTSLLGASGNTGYGSTPGTAVNGGVIVDQYV